MFKDEKYKGQSARIKELFSRGLFEGRQRTPDNMIVKLLDQNNLSPNQKVLVFNAEFLPHLLDRGVPKENIAVCCFTDAARKICGEKVHFIHQDDFLKNGTKMRFDVVSGNPQYQDSDSKNKVRMLWNQSCDKVIDVTKDDAIITLVTPHTWLYKKTNNSNSYRLFEEYQTLKAVIYRKGDTPFNVGSSISYHITQKTPRVSTTPVYVASARLGTETFVDNIDLVNDKLWPSELTEICLSIHDKINSFDKISWSSSYEFKSEKLKKKGLVSDEKTGEFLYTCHVSPKITRYTSVKFSRHSDWKVMVAISSTIDKVIVDKDCGCGDGIYTLYVGSKEEGDDIKAVLQSKLFKFIGKLYRQGRTLDLHRGFFPKVDFSKAWTDEDLYDHFGFTQDEIDYIEKNT